MSAHPAPRATRAIRAETAGSSALALGPNQRGKARADVEASIPVMTMVAQRTPGTFGRRAWLNLAALDEASRSRRLRGHSGTLPHAKASSPRRSERTLRAIDAPASVLQRTGRVLDRRSPQTTECHRC